MSKVISIQPVTPVVVAAVAACVLASTDLDQDSAKKPGTVIATTSHGTILSSAAPDDADDALRYSAWVRSLEEDDPADAMSNYAGLVPVEWVPGQGFVRKS